IVDEAKKGGYSFSTVNIGTDVDEKPKQTVVVAPSFETALGITPRAPEGAPAPAAPSPGVKPAASAPAAPPKFTKPEEVAAAKATIEAIAKAVRDPKLAPSPKALQSDEVQKKLVEVVKDKLSGGQLTMYPDIGKLSDAQLVLVVREATAVYNALTIAIPRVIVLPKGVVRAGFRDFSLDLSSFRLQPVSQEILVRHLESGSEHVIGALTCGVDEERLENFVVRSLIDFGDVSYDEQADLLYKLAGEVVAHLRSYLKDDDEVRNVLIFHAKQIADLVHTQMQPHAWEEASSYEAVVSQGFS